MSSALSENYDEVDIDVMEYDAATGVFTYPCPCGDRFEISLEELCNGEEIAYCPSCSLVVKVNYLPNDLEKIPMAAQKKAVKLN
ncbi:diphthamide biosynthesis protein 3 [Nematocida minor]|uniref:diphthamide biosynthesis protein 3 n=1 Tax=Nematocida minor TaxID=1912983 RepID=UPI002220D6C3|nr:diphthamide biosynthesis protein 3 [Nematocida minor]KAI5190795.1 diphthamide biosynthesis protein 3 [Nematocida minor]